MWFESIDSLAAYADSDVVGGNSFGTDTLDPPTALTVDAATVVAERAILGLRLRVLFSNPPRELTDPGAVRSL